MVQAIRQEITVQTDNVIEIRSSALKTGTQVEVILLLPENAPPQKSSFSSLMGKGKGSFNSPSGADAFIRAERNKWE
jgi:hypothetical protein